MDRATFDYYKNNTEEAFRRYESPGAGNSLLPHVFSPGQRVLDIGCASGRDMSQLSRLGVDAYGLEPVEAFRDHACRVHPELEGRIFTGSLPRDLPQFPVEKFDGVLLSAVLMHIPDGELFEAAYAVRSLLKENGTLLVSIPSERDDLKDVSAGPDKAGETRDDQGRLMILRPEARVRILFERLGFETEGRYHSADSLMRSGVKWVSLVFRLKGGGLSEPVDRIESIIMRDRKWATYKLALLRALCDLAQKEANSARWDSRGFVHVPINAIARKWIEYYWPIVESKQFIPQMRSEKEKGGRFIAFRKNLVSLTDRYRNLGGLDEFVFQRDDGKMDGRTQKLLSKTVGDVKKSIRQPIFYTGGGENPDKPFDYSPYDDTVILGADLWRELLLLGHIISDTLVMRWAELTADISRGEVSISQMVELLIKEVQPQRNVGDARDIYLNMENLECVWTGKSLSKRFDVDHAIPFALRHDNSLWNLFPADPRINNEKRDKLPTAELVERRRDIILHYWERMKNQMTGRFTSDYLRITGQESMPSSNWHNGLFSAFMEVLETTAVTRSAIRWNG